MTPTVIEKAEAPKEFWIKEYFPGTLSWSSEITIIGPDEWAKDKNNWADFINHCDLHVIEKSAYDKLKAEYEKLIAPWLLSAKF